MPINGLIRRVHKRAIRIPVKMKAAKEVSSSKALRAHIVPHPLVIQEAATSLQTFALRAARCMTLK